MDLDGKLRVVDLGWGLVIAFEKLVRLDDKLQRDCLLMQDRGLEQWKRYRDLLIDYWLSRRVFGVGQRLALMKLVRRK